MQDNANCELYDAIRRAQSGDETATHQLVENNMRLVYSIAHKLTGRGAELDDLIQTGSLGLLKAIQKFDPGFQVKFSTYAVPMIMGEMKRFLRDDGPVKVSRSLKVLAGKAFAVRERLAAAMGRDPSISEIADELGENPQELAAAMDAARPPESLYTPAGDSDKLLLIDTVSGGVSYEVQAIDRLALTELIRKLPQREQKIIILRYFKDKTQSQIANQLGISQVQVSRIEKKILALMRESITAG